jgi:hypothetical protein
MIILNIVNANPRCQISLDMPAKSRFEGFGLQKKTGFALYLNLN